MTINLNQIHLTWTLAKLTAKRLRRRTSTWALLLLGLAPCAMLLFWGIANITGGRINLKPYAMFLNIMSHYFLNFYVPLLAIFLGLGTISEEVESRNITFTLVRPLHRAGIVAGRLLGHLIVGILVLAICIFCNYMANMLFQIEDILHFTPMMLNCIFVFAFGFLAFITVIAVLGTFWRKFAIITGILWLILDNLFSRTPIDTLNWISISYRMSASFWETHFPYVGFTATPIVASPAWLNASFCLVVALLGAVIMAARLQYQEVILSEGAN